GCPVASYRIEPHKQPPAIMFEFMFLFPSRLPDYRRGALPSNETSGLESVFFFALPRFYREWLACRCTQRGGAPRTYPAMKSSPPSKSCAMQGSNLRLLACEASALPLS